MLGQALRYTRIGVVLAAVWVILNENARPATILTGFAVSVVAVWLTNRYVLLGSYRRTYSIRPLAAGWYALRLFFAIYLAGFLALVKMVRGNFNVGIVDVETDLDSDLAIALLANSITLTPGTVTLDRTGSRLRVIWLDAGSASAEQTPRAVKGPFERLLARVVR